MKIKRRTPPAIPVVHMKPPGLEPPEPTDDLRVLIQSSVTDQPFVWFVGRDHDTDLPIVFHDEGKAVDILDALFKASGKTRYRLIRIVKEWR